MNTDIKVCNTPIYETTNYEIFKKLLGNRAAKSEKKIIESVNKIGYIMSPLIVNEKYEVIDGQNRLAALKELGLPVHFIIVPGLKIDACRRLNIGQTNWSATDYVYSYAEEGRPEFQRLAALLNEFQKPFGLEGVCAFAFVRTWGLLGSGSYAQKFAIGEIDLSAEDYELARIRMRSALNLGFVEFGKERDLRKRQYWACVSYAYVHQDVSVKELIKKLYESPLDIPACTTVIEQLRYFDMAYNRNRKKGSTKVFMEADYQKRKYV